MTTQRKFIIFSIALSENGLATNINIQMSSLEFQIFDNFALLKYSLICLVEICCCPVFAQEWILCLLCCPHTVVCRADQKFSSISVLYGTHCTVTRTLHIPLNVTSVSERQKDRC
jgi:hypothetical protein